MQDSPTVFLSHSAQDREIANAIRTSLERADIRCWIAPRDIREGEVWEEAIVRGISACKIVLCLLTAASNDSRQVQQEIYVACEVDHKIVIPVRLEDVKPSGALALHLGRLQWIDATTRPIDRHLWTIAERVTAVLASIPSAPAPQAAPAGAQDSRATTAPGSTLGTARGTASGPAVETKPSGERPFVERRGAPEPERRAAPVPGAQKPAPEVPRTVKPQKVALLYKRSAQPDDHVLAMLESGLRAAGHDIFVDRHLRIGVEWAREIERQVRESNAVIPLLSPASVQSEMLGMEVQIASDAAAQQFGKPRILPVRVGSEGELPEPFKSILGRLQYSLWREPADDQRLLSELLDGLEAKEQLKIPKSETTGGAVPLDSRYYIVQPTDIEFYEGLERQDGLLLVKGARQMGKTSLLARGLQQARDAGKTVVFLDLQKLNREDLLDLSSLYKAIGGMIADSLKLDVYPEDNWRPARAPNINFERYIIREVMDKIEGHVVIAWDEVDRLFPFEYASETFGMFRSWFTARATNPDMPWGRLTQAFVYATEPLLFITDQNQSPFNVGTKLEMHDFTIEQVGKLNELYESPLKSEDELKRFYALFCGQPYLSRRAFFELTHQPNPLTLDQLVAAADLDEGPFGDHLRRILVVVSRDEKTLEVVTGLTHKKPIPDQKSFYGLRSGGLISGTSPEDARFRCAIYESYLVKHLGRA
jgi:hypothetical protein